MLLGIGLLLTAGCGCGLIWLAARPGARRSLPGYGWCGVGAIALLELLLARRVSAVATLFTALIWTAYIAAVDGAVRRRRGDSMLAQAGPFVALAALSMPAWLVFEAYNLRLRNWAYVGVPGQYWQFALGAAWAFATISPGIFETADLIHCGLTQAWRCRPWRCPRWTRRSMVLAGAACLILPLVMPRDWAPYSFALVWVGFILLLDPVNRALGWPSLLADFEAGRPGRCAALLLAGAACGFFWEFWNFWARARWVYIFPILHRYRIFAMPFPGFLGFPPFALECFTMYALLAGLLLPPRLRISLLTRPEPATQETLE